MDGRLFRKWCVFGCLMAAAVGCNRNNKQSPFGQMPDGGTPVVQMPVNNAGSKSLWGGSNKSPSVPVEVAPETSKKPASPEALVAIANVQLDAAFDEKTAPGSKEGLLDTARKGYQRALQQAPKNKAAMLGMAQFYAKTNDREKAVEMYKKCLTQHPEAEIAHEVAIAHARWKDWGGAVAWCDYTLKIDPENRSVKKTKGFCQAFAGQWDESFATLCQIMPEAQARHNLAGLLDQMGQTDKCKVQLRMAVKADPNFAPARGFLAELDQPRDPNGVRQAADAQPAP